MPCLARLTFVALLLTVVNSTATSQEVSRPGLRFTDVSDMPGFVPTAMHAMGVEDFDGDSDLDLVCGGWPVAGGAYRSTIYRNDGGFKFTDVSPPHWAKIKPTGSGVAIGDVNGDVPVLPTYRLPPTAQGPGCAAAPPGSTSPVVITPAGAGVPTATRTTTRDT